MFWPVHCHPDFGYLAPRPRFWKLVRVGAIAGILGLLAGSIGVIALSQRLEIELLREEFAATVRSRALFAFTPSSERASAGRRRQDEAAPFAAMEPATGLATVTPAAATPSLAEAPVASAPNAKIPDPTFGPQ